jgi:hypothetical protein
MEITEIRVVIACPSSLKEQVEEAAASIRLADVIANHLANELDTEHVAVEIL